MISEAMENMPFSDLGLGLATIDNIQKQQASFCEGDIPLPKDINPEIIHYDDTLELPSLDNVYEVPKNKSMLGFMCGRWNFMQYKGNHPDHDCCFCNAWLPVITCTDIIGNVAGGFFPSIVWAMCDKGPLSNCSLKFFSPLISTSVITSCITGMCVVGYFSYKCAELHGDQDFIESYKRGQLCLPDDMCSCSSLFGSKDCK